MELPNANSPINSHILATLFQTFVASSVLTQIVLNTTKPATRHCIVKLMLAGFGSRLVHRKDLDLMGSECCMLIETSQMLRPDWLDDCLIKHHAGIQEGALNMALSLLHSKLHRFDLENFMYLILDFHKFSI